MQWIAESIQALFGQPTESDGNALQASGKLTKEQLLKFFEAGHKMFDDPMVKLKLKEVARKRQDVDYVITQMQKQIFESQGIDGNFGIAFLAKIRTIFKDDADMIHHLMKFVEREELALDEAELTIDDFLKKLEIREWAVSQYQAMQKQIVNMSPQQQREFMHQQQAMIKEVTQESKDIAQKAESMTPEEKQKFIEEQVRNLQERFKINPSSHQHSHDCQDCDHVLPSIAPSGPGMGSVMTPEEQASFFKSLYSKPR